MEGYCRISWISILRNYRSSFMDRNSDRLLYLINKWSRKNGRKANVGELLRACQKAGVPLPLIKEEYSKSHLS